MILAGALTIDALIGYPDRLRRAIGHPADWTAGIITRLDDALNENERWQGVVAMLLLLGLVMPTGWLLQLALLHLPWAGLPLAALIASTLYAQRSLNAHMARIGKALQAGDLEEARRGMARIAGADTRRLDEHGVARTAIESLAENFADGVVAPAFWCLLGGLPGLLAYKAANIADRLVGHRTPRHQRFGWAAARLDDLLNLPAARLAALWLLLAAVPLRLPWKRGLRVALRDARHHRSPNAGWPEAAMAGVLRLRLAGPRLRYGEMVEEAWMGYGRADADAADLRRALGVFRTACLLHWAAMLALAGWAST
jgi:adenosylcobinamide-phosphate synthase